MAVTILGKKCGNIYITHGTFTHAVGGAAESMVVAGRVLGAVFQNCDSTGEHDVEIPYSLSQNATTGITTITIYCNAVITAGRFMVFHTG